MKRILTGALFYFICLTAYGQISKDYVRIKDEADLCLQNKDYTCAKTKYNLALKIKTNDTYCKQQLAEINEREIQLKKNKEEKLRLDRSIEAEGRRISAKPYYGTLKGIYDSNYEKFDYTGYILKKRPHGKGRADYYVYNKMAGWEETTWVNGIANGPVKGSYANGTRYEGVFKDYKAEGVGRFYTKDGSIYENFFKDGKMVGIQKIYYPDKSRIEVESENGQLEGKAVGYTINGERMVGYFRNSDFQGEVTLFMANGDKMVGTCNYGQFNGLVKLYFSEGGSFEGNFVNNLCEGRGITYLSNGGTIESMFERGNPVGNATWKFKDGAKYIGEMKDGVMNGYGTFRLPDGLYYEGYWLNGKYNGLGRLTVPPKDYVLYCLGAITYEGEWKNGLKDGYGKCYNVRGKLLYDGKFVNDRPVEKYPSKKRK